MFLFFFKLKDWNVVVNLGSVFLCDTFRDPNNVTTFLFLQFQIGIENSKVKLLHECVNIQFDLKEIFFKNERLICL